MSFNILLSFSLCLLGAHASGSGDISNPAEHAASLVRAGAAETAAELRELSSAFTKLLEHESEICSKLEPAEVADCPSSSQLLEELVTLLRSKGWPLQVDGARYDSIKKRVRTEEVLSIEEQLRDSLAKLEEAAGDSWAIRLLEVKGLIGRLWQVQETAFKGVADMNDELAALVLRVILMADAQEAARVPPASAAPAVPAPLALPLMMAPPNNCALGPSPAAEVLLTCGEVVTGSTTECEAPAQFLPECGTPHDGQTYGTRTVQYTLLGTGGDITLSTCDAGTTYDTKIHVFADTGFFPGACVAGNDDITCPIAVFRSGVTFRTTFGTRYLVYVSGYRTEFGTFALSVNCPLPAVACGHGFHLSGGICLPNECICTNGQGGLFANTACPCKCKRGTHVIPSCSFSYLEPNSTTLNFKALSPGPP